MKGILIAESGATKTEWRLCKDGQVIQAFKSEGLNPNTCTESDLLIRLQRVQASLKERVSILHFYGAGLRTVAEQQKMQTLLLQVFAHSRVEVAHDLQGAVRATRKTEGLVLVLGTGSVACQHRDYRIFHLLGGHGFLLGDEGSGFDIGRQLLKGLLEESLPGAIRAHIVEAEGCSVLELRRKIYAAPQPHVQLAQLARHASALQDHPAIHELVSDRFRLLLRLTLELMPRARQLPLDAWGSVAFHFQDRLRAVCAERGFELEQVAVSPIEGLVLFHQ